jgi:hypothetical protein
MSLGAKSLIYTVCLFNSSANLSYYSLLNSKDGSSYITKPLLNVMHPLAQNYAQNRSSQVS